MNWFSLVKNALRCPQSFQGARNVRFTRLHWHAYIGGSSDRAGPPNLPDLVHSKHPPPRSAESSKEQLNTQIERASVLDADHTSKGGYLCMPIHKNETAESFPSIPCTAFALAPSHQRKSIRKSAKPREKPLLHVDLRPGTAKPVIRTDSRYDWCPPEPTRPARTATRLFTNS